MRKVVDQHISEGLLAVYLSFSNGCQFHVLSPTLNGPHIKMNQIHTFQGPEVSVEILLIMCLNIIMILRTLKILVKFYRYFFYPIFLERSYRFRNPNQSPLVSLEMWKWRMCRLYSLSRTRRWYLESSTLRKRPWCRWRSKNWRGFRSTPNLFAKHFLSFPISVAYYWKGSFGKWYIFLLIRTSSHQIILLRKMQWYVIYQFLFRTYLFRYTGDRQHFWEMYTLLTQQFYGKGSVWPLKMKSKIHWEMFSLMTMNIWMLLNGVY